MTRFRDGGYASRKLWYSIGTSTGIMLAGVLAAVYPAFRPSLETVVGGLLGTLAVYSGANVGGKLASGKAASYVKELQAEDQASEDSEPDPKQPVEPLPE